MNPDIKRFTAANRTAWDASAPLHGQGAGWDALLAGFSRRGFSVLDQTLTATLEALHPQGKHALQVGCNNGRELLSLRALGAVPSLGIDQSAGFLAQAAQLARLAGEDDCEFLCADIYALPDGIEARHELGLITIGVLNWMPDLQHFFRVVADLLAPGAALVIYETHPFLEVFDPTGEDPLRPVTSYFSKAPLVETAAITYDGSDGGEGAESFWFIHTLGQIVTACVQAGLQIESLSEHPHCNREVEYQQYEHQEAQLPLCYTLVARKSA
jgi:SAM-dependent methyltransferase